LESAACVWLSDSPLLTVAEEKEPTATEPSAPPLPAEAEEEIEKKGEEEAVAAKAE
jgi:hypothetical protein